MSDRRADHRTFRPIELGRSHEYVAEQIRRQIMLRLIPPQGSLPPERELARSLGVGRATVQEAIRLLEEEGMLTSRRGRSGGTFVVGPTDVEESLPALVPKLRGEMQLIEEALAFRRAIEPTAAALAARFGSDDDRADLRRAHEEGLLEVGNAEMLAPRASKPLALPWVTRCSPFLSRHGGEHAAISSTPRSSRPSRPAMNGLPRR
jgi:DNA-binding FadR family transcriptional regulator